MRKTDLIIPAALQLILDDVGWMYGRDERSSNHPSRSGLPRRHVLEDYITVNEIGKAVGMKVNVMFVIGEWDINNILRHVPHAARDGEKWDSAKYLNPAEAEQIRDFLNSSENIEIGLHGLLHDAFNNGVNISGQEYFLPENLEYGAPRHLAPESYIRAHFDAFYEIYNTWGFNQKIRSFVSPAGPGNGDAFAPMSRILRDYGISYWANHYPLKNARRGDCDVNSGVIFNRKAIELAPWEAYDLDPDELPTYAPETSGIIGGHWPNVLRYNPKHDLERVSNWKAYFDRQFEVFGQLHSTDIAFAQHQQLYKYWTEISEDGSGVKFDFSAIDAKAPAVTKSVFYVSVRNGADVPKCDGGDIDVYEKKQNFITYRIDRGNSTEITLY